MLHRQSLGFITYFARAYPVRTAVMVPLMILAGVADGVGIVTLLPLLELALGGTGSTVKSSLARSVSDSLQVFGLEPTLGVLLVVLVLGISLKAAFLWLAMWEVGYTVAHVAADLRLKLIRALLKARWAYFTSLPPGHFATAIASEAHRASQAYRQACRVLAGLIQVMIYVAVALIVSWRVAVLAVLAGALLTLLLGRFIDVSRRAGRTQTRLMRSLVGRLTDALRGIKPMKAMAREGHLSPLLERETQGINDAQVRHVIASEALKSFQEPLLAIMLAVGLYIAVTVGSEPLPSLLVMAFLFYRLVGRVNQLQTQYQSMALGESAFWSIRGMADIAEAERESSPGRLKPFPLKKGIRLDCVSFSYAANNVLTDVSLSIPAGQFVALIGPSGAGKTTIADLILSLHRPQMGEIYIDGVPMRELDLAAWRRLVGYVPQELFLFHDSVFNNVTLGDSEITREEVEQALVTAAAWDFVPQLPQGMDTVVGEAGSKLSGGQRQRIAIARALVRKPTLLVLDEVTTALDPQTEAAISRTLGQLRGTMTILSISHQPAMIEVADMVYRIENGHVTEAEQRLTRAPATIR